MSSSSLYGYTGNVTVSANNLTTLYNAQPGNVTVANVPDRNFTTLYTTSQNQVSPTRAYGNANVEAFLNSGTDGANNVQNIRMSGTLSVGGQSQLGPVGNVHIDGGQLNYVLATDGGGGLFWKEQDGFIGNIVPYIHFDVTSSGNNQQFTNANIAFYPANTQMNVMKNGVNIEPEFYQKVGNTTIQIDIPLNAGDDIDILAMGSGSEPAGNILEVQFNGGGVFAANANFTFDQANAKLNVTNINTGNITSNNITVAQLSNLGSVGNITITGGSNGQVLTTYGNGTLHWTTVSGGGNGTPGGNTTEIQFNNAGAFDGNANLRLDLANNQFVVGTQMSVGNVASFDNDVAFNKAGGNIYVNNFAYFRGEGFGVYPTNGVFFDMTGATGFVDFVGNVRFNDAVAAGTYNVQLGNVSEVKITGGTSGQVLSTNGSGGLSWISTGGTPGGSNTQIQYNNNGNFGAISSLTFNSATGNVVSSGTFNVTGNLEIQRAFEIVTSNSTGSTGTIDFDTITQSILFKTANATANCTLNIRGNSTVSLNTLMPVNDSMTIVYLNTVGATPYIISQLQIDGTNVTPKWVNGGPTYGTRLTSCVQSYTFTIVKTASNTYTVFANLAEFQ